MSVSARSLASLEGLRASCVKFSSFGTLKPGTLRQSQFRPLVVRAAAVVPPEYTRVKKPGNHRVLVKIDEEKEEKRIEEAKEFFESNPTVTEVASWLMEKDPVKAEDLIQMDRDTFTKVLMDRFEEFTIEVEKDKLPI
ncbi:unnamed protein product [Arabis nemorensis]|uniref:Uncharacterized protein n=1 Tax=Arabis nemorensis TaxID=586526 RepID=A0A565CQU5_9BRAS|nr:unnamed protein product [Arabis nemorensis]